jgi:hypothetical protein
MREGNQSLEVVSYLDSVLWFSGASEEPGFEALKAGGRYRTTEAEILHSFVSPVSSISEERGLELVREACDELERQVTALRRGSKATKAVKAGTNAD